ncbi:MULTISPECIES: uroporphyrinogen-III synthase [Paraliobacillus]|uniref:uroporphyrinogen-III synthase n=1 Tax=Paraliobacillus TaxID=200903 RepID=UPI000DD2CA3A|nr:MULTISPECIES: uroporphyrinogen-III synthase [Paraliobacillus]
MMELEGKKIGVTADRKADEISTIIRKKGGTPVIRSIQGERILLEEKAEQDVEHLIAGDYDWVILTTGIGAKGLENAAKNLGVLELYIETLRGKKLAIRGSKTLNWMKQWDLKPYFSSPDGTMDKLIEELKTNQIDGQKFFFQAYNKDEEELLNQLRALPIFLYQSMPYYYNPPEAETLENLRTLIETRELDAVLFTSKTQVENLFSDYESIDRLIEAFESDVLAVNIGIVTEMQVRDFGVNRLLTPEKPKMGAMVISLANYYKTKEKPANTD